jgi:hypothetical protein
VGLGIEAISGKAAVRASLIAHQPSYHPAQPGTRDAERPKPSTISLRHLGEKGPGSAFGPLSASETVNSELKADPGCLAGWPRFRSICRRFVRILPAAEPLAMQKVEGFGLWPPRETRGASASLLMER